MKKSNKKRSGIPPFVSEGTIPLLSLEGSSFDCGEKLGFVWRDRLRLVAAGRKLEGRKPWWMGKQKPIRELLGRYSPHLPDLYRGMAKGADLPEDQIDTLISSEAGGCTSFAIHPDATLDGLPISGQTKDTKIAQALRYVVLSLKLSDAPSLLTLTYPGMLFGHGFAEGGCSIFRNSLFGENTKGILPYEPWGILANHCPSVEDVVEMTRKYGVSSSPFHSSVADEHGGIVGIESSASGIGVLRASRGIYTHANAIRSPRLLGDEIVPKKDHANFSLAKANSTFREKRVETTLRSNHGRLTAPLAYMSLCDHEGYPLSVCRHESCKAMTTAIVVAEPTRRRLHVCRGNPCLNWPMTYTL